MNIKIGKDGKPIGELLKRDRDLCDSVKRLAERASQVQAFNRAGFNLQLAVDVFLSTLEGDTKGIAKDYFDHEDRLVAFNRQQLLDESAATT